jgi:hypothetical protein
VCQHEAQSLALSECHHNSHAKTLMGGGAITHTSTMWHTMAWCHSLKHSHLCRFSSKSLENWMCTKLLQCNLTPGHFDYVTILVKMTNLHTDMTCTLSDDSEGIKRVVRMLHMHQLNDQNTWQCHLLSKLVIESGTLAASLKWATNHACWPVLGWGANCPWIYVVDTRSDTTSLWCVTMYNVMNGFNASRKTC